MATYESWQRWFDDQERMAMLRQVLNRVPTGFLEMDQRYAEHCRMYGLPKASNGIVILRRWLNPSV